MKSRKINFLLLAGVLCCLTAGCTGEGNSQKTIPKLEKSSTQTQKNDITEDEKTESENLIETGDYEEAEI